MPSLWLAHVNLGLNLKKTKRGKLLLSHRSTSYLCYIPVLEDYEGAGRKRLTPCKCRDFFLFERTIYGNSYASMARFINEIMANVTINN